MEIDKVVRFPILSYKVSEKEVLLTLNYSYRSTKLPNNWNEIYQPILDEARTLAEPKGSYIIRKISHTDEEGIHLASTDFVLPGENMKKLLKDSTMVVIFGVTIGEELERRVAKLLEEGRYLNGIILDAIGSVIADSTADTLNNIIKREASILGYKTTPRYSPGYGDLKIETQKMFLKEIDGKSLGIELSPANLMVPQKSVTALLGIFQK